MRGFGFRRRQRIEIDTEFHPGCFRAVDIIDEVIVQLLLAVPTRSSDTDDAEFFPGVRRGLEIKARLTIAYIDTFHHFALPPLSTIRDTAGGNPAGVLNLESV